MARTLSGGSQSIQDQAQSDREARIRLRLQQAVWALRHSPGPRRYLAKIEAETGEPMIQALWPDFEREKGDIWYDEDIRFQHGTITRVHATRADISAMEEVLPWIYSITDLRHRLAVVIRASPGPERAMGWRRVAAELTRIAKASNRPWLACSHDTARRWEKEGVQVIRQLVV